MHSASADAAIGIDNSLHGGLALLDALGDGVVVVGADWRVAYVSAPAAAWVHPSRDAALGAELWHALPWLAGSAAEPAVRATMADRTPRAVSGVTLPGRAGDAGPQVLDVRCHAVPAGGGAGDGGVLLLLAEVGEREREFRRLAQRSAESERLRQLARTMAAVADSPELLDRLCTAAIELCGAHGATVAQIDGERGRFIASIGHPAEVRGHGFPLEGTLTGRLLAEYRGSGRAALLRVHDAEARDAAYCPWLASGRRVGAIVLAPLTAHGELLGVLAISRSADDPPFDAADEQRLCAVADHASLALWKARLIEEAQAASRTKSSFLATVSHELRTPLTALTGYGELLAEEVAGPLNHAQKDVIERMRTVTHQLTAMIEEILTFSSLEAGRELVRPVRVDLADVVATAATVVEPLAEQKGLAFSVDVPALTAPLVTDPDKVRQILVNLCGNAVKFTERGRVTLTATEHEGRVRIAVADTGVGISRADLDRLFQPYTQLDAGLTRRYGGTGLGLYISLRLAQLLEGTIEVVSTPGEGSVFTLVLPLGERPPAGAAGAGGGGQRPA